MAGRRPATSATPPTPAAKNNGWLPDGTYQPRLVRDYGGNLIKGRAIYLGQKPCANGTMRTDLFIHTEQGAGSRQCPNRPGDQLCRWEYPRINDYRSYGCVEAVPRRPARAVRRVAPLVPARLDAAGDRRVS